MEASNESLVGYRCPRCGGSEVGHDAYSRFDPVLQDWVLGGQYDNGWCADCGEVEPEQYRLEGDELERVLNERRCPEGEPVAVSDST